MNIRLVIFISMMMGLISAPAQASDICVPFVTNVFRDSRSTEAYLSYLSSLLDQGVITDQHLQSLALSASLGQIKNPISQVESQLNSAAGIHHAALQEMIENEQLVAADIFNG